MYLERQLSNIKVKEGINKMLDESMAHYREIIQSAAQLMSVYFHKPIHFSKVIQVSEPERRNVILRLLIDNPTTEMPRSLIFKKTVTETNKFASASHETEIEQLSRFAHDWAGIEFLTQIGNNHCPHFYAGSLEYKFILIEDLGPLHPSLVGPLTRSSSVVHLRDAKSALISYVRRLGKMHADTVGKYDQFTSILNRIYPRALRYISIPEIDGAEVLKQFKLMTGDKSKELHQEIQDILEFSKSSSDFHVFLHGDICPDNVYYQGSEMRLIDFEFSDFGNALIDGVYLRMHMPSCWCSKAVPEAVLHRMEAVYREELKVKISASVDDDIYRTQLTYACAYWLLRTMLQLEKMALIDHEWICPSGSVDSDSEWDPKENAFRPRILSRILAFIACAKKTGELPNLCEASTRLLSQLKKFWPETRYIDFFSVFRDLR